MTEGLPESTSLHLDAQTRRRAGGRTLVGGSPLRVLRLTDAGSRIVDDLEDGQPVGPSPTRQALARRLLDAGMAHPVPARAPELKVGVVVPVRDHAPQLRRLLDALDRSGVADVVVVDDGSARPLEVADAAAGRARVVRHDDSRGPAAARNTGWRSVGADVVAFVDADVTLARGWLPPLLAHFADPAVAAVAPRVAARPGDSLLDRYEARRSPLDLGAAPARVLPRGRVSYVPSAAILVRRTVLDQTGGFDEGMPVGEDVDLVWRTVAAGHTVRYEPAVVAMHDNRGNWPDLVRQRFAYGSSAAPLDARHAGQVPPVELDASSLLSWTLIAFGGTGGVAAGAVVGAGSAVALAPRLERVVDDPLPEALRLAGLGTLWSGRWLAQAVTRAWLPAALVASACSRRAGRATLAALVVPALVEWSERRPDVDPVRWVAIRLLDDAAYCAGVWTGCRRARSWRALRPRLSHIPGLTQR